MQVLRKTNKKGSYLQVIRPDTDRLLPLYYRLKDAKTTYVANMGGGGSGKSVATAQFLVRRCLAAKEKILVLRKYATSLTDSVVSQFVDDAIPFWCLKEGKKNDFTHNKSNRSITFHKTGSKIIFKGLDDPEKIKSVQGITIVWVEEATEITENEFNIMSDRIRGEPQIFLTYNPISDRHWLKRRFHDQAEEQKDRITVLFSTYLENPFIGSKFKADMEWYRLNNPDHYRVYALGKWGIIRPENPFFSAFKATVQVSDHIEYDPNYPVYLSWDFNKVNTCLVRQKVGNQLRYLEVIHGQGDLQEMVKYIVLRYGKFNMYYITGDSTGRGHSAYSTGNRPAYELIEGYFRENDANYLEKRLILKNPSLSSSRHYVNALISYYGPKLLIDRTMCGMLIDDLDRTKTTADGSLDKKDANKEDYGHAADTFRYDLHAFEAETFDYLKSNGLSLAA